MIETTYLIAYRRRYSAPWHWFAGCDQVDCCMQIARDGAMANPWRQYAVFRNESEWHLRQPLFRVGRRDGARGSR